ncbi:MAG: O-antigen ligase family protein, partial [Planctomycetota bacterium]
MTVSTEDCPQNYTKPPDVILRRVKAVFHAFILIGLFIILISSPLMYGAVENWQVNILVIVSIFVFVSWSVLGVFFSEDEIAKKRRSKLLLLVRIIPVFFIFLILLQIAPFSENILGVLSPAKAALNKEVGIDNTSTVSMAPYTTKLWIFRVIAYALVFYVITSAFINRRLIVSMVALIVAFGYLLSLYGLLQYLSNNSLPAFINQTDADRATGTFINPNHFAGFLELCAPLALSIVFIGKRRWGHGEADLWRRINDFILDKLHDRTVILPVAAFIIIALGIIFSLSRMGILAFIISVFVFLMTLWRAEGKFVRTAVIFAILAVVFIVCLWFGLDPVFERYLFIKEDAVGRYTGWKLAIDSFKDNSILGTGLGTFTYVSRLYQTH